MNKELIMKLIDKAREASDNTYCPYTNVPVGCALMTSDNTIFCGCNIETKNLVGSVTAGEVAVIKAISEGYTSFAAVCFYSDTMMPYPDGGACQIIADFAPMIRVIVSNKDTFNLHYLHEIFRFSPEFPEVDS